jgi:transposase
VVLGEYGKVVNFFIQRFWQNCPSKSKLLKDIVNLPDTWLTARLRKVAAREAIDMVQGSKRKKGSMPIHRGKRMCVSSTIASFIPSRNTLEFDAWLHLSSIGNGVILNLPVKLHRHFHRWNDVGTRLESYIITDKDVQFSFEVVTEEKKTKGDLIGIDSGINALASLSNGKQYGLDIRQGIERINRCQHGSKGQKRAIRALKQRIDEVVKEIMEDEAIRLIVVEKLKDIKKKMKLKGRLSRNMRSVVYRWYYSYWLQRLQQATETRRSSFRSVSAFYTSQECPACSLIDKRNRNGELFLCRECGYTGNADITASKNILNRFLTGKYGSCFKPSTSTQVDLSRI